MKQITRKLIALLLVLTTLVFLSACTTETPAVLQETTTEAPATEATADETGEEVVTETFPEEGVFVYIGRGLSDPFCALNAYAMQDVFLEAHPGWSFIIKDADNDAAKLIQIIEDATAQGVDIIADGGVAGADATSAVKDAIANGIFVYGVEVACSETEPEIAPYVCVDFYHTYKVLMDWSVDQIPENANAVVLSGIQGFEPCVERERALNEMLEQRPDINILAWQYANYATDDATVIMEDWLQVYDNIDAVISLTDTMAIGAIEAYHAAGIDCKDVWICGVDALLDACNYIKEGELDVSVFRPPVAYANAELSLCERYYDGDITDQGEVVVIEPEIIVTLDNVDEIIAAQE